ncbi:1,6-anhydro-N-acetylmuramyl-L-alanine amidase AmpD [Aliagarivorans taiwanensis]|uniref:1,6-anhydro-N-acetylmuramyl-L-alanine amidase AmpD n=1 Tax=Aliagarivorans taiwanensis TaxID=561966 RepID=UPI0003FCA398|nr:1,6-anhydro-N-acetylmuramyl-L-alanine amidase AmpD [Aliagarivorans taiwanensis]
MTQKLPSEQPEQRLTDALWTPSPHFDDRPDPSDISLVVIHCISLPEGQFGGPQVTDLFQGCLDCQSHPGFEELEGLRVSAHLFIDREGQLQQFVELDKRAWHAGVSSFEGRERCNDFSIGIELEGTDHSPFTDAQYQRLAEVCQSLLARYPNLSKSRIVGHSDIAPGRKTDPGREFDWSRLLSQLSK